MGFATAVALVLGWILVGLQWEKGKVSEVTMRVTFVCISMFVGFVLVGGV